MLQLKHIRALSEISGAAYSEIQPIQFGVSVPFNGTTQILASYQVPENSSLVVLRIQCYAIDEGAAQTDYLFYRSFPPGQSFWEIANDGTTYGNQTWVNPAYLDTDVLIIFPSNKFANLIFTPSALPPAAGTWAMRTIVFAYLVPSKVTDALGGTQALVTG